MAEKIKRTHAERDALLSKVFDSTLQTKDIEITEAGTMEIAPDEGFFALKKVNLNVNVQGGSGGEGGGGSNENTYEYIDVRELAELKAPLIMYSLAVRVRGADNYTMPITSLLASTDSAESVFDGVMAVMLDLSFVLDLGSDGKFETREMFTTMGIDLSSLPHLTKEEFYAL